MYQYPTCCILCSDVGERSQCDSRMASLTLAPSRDNMSTMSLHFPVAKRLVCTCGNLPRSNRPSTHPSAHSFARYSVITCGLSSARAYSGGNVGTSGTGSNRNRRGNRSECRSQCRSKITDLGAELRSGPLMPVERRVHLLRWSQWAAGIKL